MIFLTKNGSWVSGKGVLSVGAFFVPGWAGAALDDGLALEFDDVAAEGVAPLGAAPLAKRTGTGGMAKPSFVVEAPFVAAAAAAA